MRRRACVVLALLGVPGCAPSTPEGIADADKAAIRANLGAYATSALNGSWEAWGMTMAEDVVFMPPNSAPLVGRAAAVTFGKAFPTLTKLLVEPLDIAGRGDLAYVRGRYSLAVRMPDGSATSDSGSFLDVYRRQTDGGWLNAQLMWHTDIPAVAPTAGPPRR